MTTYFCLYAGTNLIELLQKEEATPEADYAVISGFCASLDENALLLRSQLFEKMYEG